MIYDLTPVPREIEPPSAKKVAQEPRDIAANLIDAYQQLWTQPFEAAATAQKSLELPRSGKSDLGSILFDNAMFQIESAVKFAASVPTMLKSVSEVVGKISDPKSRDSEIETPAKLRSDEIVLLRRVGGEAMDQVRDELLYSSVKGKNPFKDVRVREAFFKAIDVELIKTRVMRGLSTPSALMIAPQLYALSKDFTRPKFDPDGAKKLLAEAGYPDGFEVTMDCPNDRYVNDAAICQAVVGMLARIGVKVNLLAQPKAQYFAKVLKPGGYQTSFYLLGWTPGTSDSHDILNNMMGCRDDPKIARGEANLGGYCNKKIDELAAKVLVEPDTAKRDLLIEEAFEIALKEFAYIPLHQQPLACQLAACPACAQVRSA